MSMKRTLTALSAALLLAGCGESGRVFGFDRSGPDEFTVVRNPPLSVPPEATLRPPAHGEAQSNRDLSSDQARASLLAAGGDTAGSAGTLVTDSGAEPYDGGPLTTRQDDGSSPWYQTLQPPTQTTVAEPSATATPGVESSATATPGVESSATATLSGEQTTAVADTYPQTTAPATPQYGTPDVPILYDAQSRPSTGEVALTQRATAYYGVESDVRRKVDAESAQVALEQKSFTYTVLFWLEPEPAGTALDADEESRRLRENDALGKPVNAGESPVIDRKKSGISGLF
jgi:hypothetical protein